MIHNRRSADKLKAMERRYKAFKLRLKGLSYREIAKELGVSNHTVYQYIAKEMKYKTEKIRELAEDVKYLELYRLDELMYAHYDEAIKGSIKASKMVLSIMERKAKLLGLDSSQEFKLNISGTLSDKSDEELMAAIMANKELPANDTK